MRISDVFAMGGDWNGDCGYSGHCSGGGFSYLSQRDGGYSSCGGNYCGNYCRNYCGDYYGGRGRGLLGGIFN